IPGGLPLRPGGRQDALPSGFPRQRGTPEAEARVHQPDRRIETPGEDGGAGRPRRTPHDAGGVRRALRPVATRPPQHRKGLARRLPRPRGATPQAVLPRAEGARGLKRCFGAMRLSASGVQTVRDFVSEMVEQVEAGSLAPKTVNNALSCLSTCLKDAVALGKIPSNPCDHVAPLPDRHIERDWLRRHEIPLYLDASSDAYRPLAELLIATGLRISEALALRWDDV